MTLPLIILHVLKYAKGWVPSHQLEKVNTPWGWIGTSGTRRCRTLENDGLIENDEMQEKRINPPYTSYRITEKGLEKLRETYAKFQVETPMLSTMAQPALFTRSQLI
jgi:hypothetical protein